VLRSTLNHAPRPGALARTSGAICPSGPNARRTNSSWGRLSPVKIHLRCGARSKELEGVSLGSFRIRVLPYFTFSSRRYFVFVFVFEPVCSGSHDNLVALLFGQTIAGQNTIGLRLAIVIAAARFAAAFQYQFVGGQIGNIIKRFKTRFAQSY